MRSFTIGDLVTVVNLPSFDPGLIYQIVSQTRPDSWNIWPATKRKPWEDPALWWFKYGYTVNTAYLSPVEPERQAYVLLAMEELP